MARSHLGLGTFHKYLTTCSFSSSVFTYRMSCIASHRIAECHLACIDPGMLSIVAPLHELALLVLFWYSTLVLPYLIWAVVISDNRFHRVWSPAPFLLSYLTLLLFNLPFSTSNHPLAVVTLSVLVLFLFGICIILPRAELVLFHTTPIAGKKKALDVFNPEKDVAYSVEFVQLSQVN